MSNFSKWFGQVEKLTSVEGLATAIMGLPFELLAPVAEEDSLLRYNTDYTNLVFRASTTALGLRSNWKDFLLRLKLLTTAVKDKDIPQATTVVNLLATSAKEMANLADKLLGLHNDLLGRLSQDIQELSHKKVDKSRKINIVFGLTSLALVIVILCGITLALASSGEAANLVDFGADAVEVVDAAVAGDGGGGCRASAGGGAIALGIALVGEGVFMLGKDKRDSELAKLEETCVNILAKWELTRQLLEKSITVQWNAIEQGSEVTCNEIQILINQLRDVGQADCLLRQIRVISKSIEQLIKALDVYLVYCHDAGKFGFLSSLPEHLGAEAMTQARATIHLANHS